MKISSAVHFVSRLLSRVTVRPCRYTSTSEGRRSAGRMAMEARRKEDRRLLHLSGIRHAGAQAHREHHRVPFQ